MHVALLVRHPGGYLASMRRLGWGSFHDPAARADTFRTLCGDQWRAYLERFEHASAFERELIFWIIANDTPMQEVQDAGRFMLICYEDLCFRTHRTMESLCDFAGIEYGESMRRMVANTQATHTGGERSIWRDPMRVVEQWKSELSAGEQAMIRRYLRNARIGQLWPAG